MFRHQNQFPMSIFDKVMAKKTIFMVYIGGHFEFCP